ncbi:hypothetical protein [Catenulispora subtropica]|uniref:Uncharacterized protein n=1 Tax=Catenulispora subtropica TaxID=450798 RepID=A0ABP5CI92_9ACTN
MGDQFQLTLRNESDQPGLTFAVYTVIDSITNATETFPMAWQVKRLNKGNKVTFKWTLDYWFMFSAQGAQAGAIWEENGSIDVSDTSKAQNSVLLDYDGDYLFRYNPGAHPVRDGYVYLDTSAQVPKYTPENGPSVALAIATGDGTPSPAVAGNSGINLDHEFKIHPTYYIQAGQVELGQMADLTTTTALQKVVFEPGVYQAFWTLTEENTWTQG